MENDPTETRVYLFSLRVWDANQTCLDAPQWRIRLQDLGSGEVRFCKDLESLPAHIVAFLCEQKTRTP